MTGAANGEVKGLIVSLNRMEVGKVVINDDIKAAIDAYYEQYGAKE